MTVLDPAASPDVPMLTEEAGNSILDTVAETLLPMRNEDGDWVDLPTSQRLMTVFGPLAETVMRMVYLAAAAGHDTGLLAVTPTGERTDILAAGLRRVHTADMFGDCVEDGDHYPCKTARILDLVAGAPEPAAATPTHELEEQSLGLRDLTFPTQAEADALGDVVILGMVRRDQLRAGDGVFTPLHGIRTVQSVAVLGTSVTVTYTPGEGAPEVESTPVDARVALVSSAD